MSGRKTQPKPKISKDNKHQIAAGKYRVVEFDRTRSERKGKAKWNYESFDAKKNAESFARSRSKSNGDGAYLVIDENLKVKGVYTNGKQNKSLTDGLKKQYSSKGGDDDRIKLLK